MSRIQYVVYHGEEVKCVEHDLDKAEKFYNSLPSGQGQSWSRRRSLVKEETILTDTR